jgi:hypothetical protein
MVGNLLTALDDAALPVVTAGRRAIYFDKKTVASEVNNMVRK